MEAVNSKPDNAVGTATALRAVQPRNRCSISCRRKSVVLRTSRPCSGTYLISYTLGNRDPAPLVKRPKREIYHSPPSGSEIKNAGQVHLSMRYLIKPKESFVSTASVKFDIQYDLVAWTLRPFQTHYVSRVGGRRQTKQTSLCISNLNETKLNSVAIIPQANYTDRATAACGRISANFCG
jgi:hypothetical protein